MFLLKRPRDPGITRPAAPLHSTMFLLKLFRAMISPIIAPALHSTMFLLKQDDEERLSSLESLYIPQCFY